MQYDEEDTRNYEVVMNHEEQYSIWLTGREIPAGWTAVGKSGQKAECLAYIEEVWTDMRPLSLRRHMEAFEAERAAQAAPGTDRAAEIVPTVEHAHSGPSTDGARARPSHDAAEGVQLQ